MRYTTLIIIAFAALVHISCEDGSNGDGASLTGKSGSLARFALTDTHLYAVDDEQLNVYQILGDGGLGKINSFMIGEGVETIFARDTELFIGTTSAMLTFDITNPSAPNLLSTYSHFVACDPVVVQDTLAFVTIRSNNCRAASVNQLDILNIKDLANPVMLSSYSLDSPYGLGVDGNLLFVCEGDFGLKVLNVSNPRNATLIKHYSNVHAYDVIPNDGILILTGDDGIMQYDYSNESNITMLSTIPVQQQ
jgi:WD40 repeat protein